MTAASPSKPRGPKPTKVDPDQLLDAAQAVFAEDGLRAASLRAIARRAGCDPALIYYHFASKEALFAALLQRRFPGVLKDVERLAEVTNLRPTAQRLWEVLLIYHRHLSQDPGIRALVRGEIAKGAEGIADLIEAQMRPVVMAIPFVTSATWSRCAVRAVTALGWVRRSSCGVAGSMSSVECWRTGWRWVPGGAPGFGASRRGDWQDESALRPRAAGRC